MTTIATLAVNVLANSAEYAKSLDEAEKRTGAFSANVSKFAKSAFSGIADIGKGVLLGATAAVGVGIGAATVVLKGFVNEAMQSQQVEAQLNAVLQSTGGIAGVTADAVNKYSDAMSMRTGIDDEAITSAQSMLLTFTDIGKNVFPKAADAVLDMTTAMNGGAIPSAEQLRQQAIQLGKALQDPDAGLGALHRVGVNTDELTKKFTPLMSKEEKQLLILKELSSEFGGSAEAAGKTFAGQLAILQVRFGNFKESIGSAVMPALSSLMGTFVDIAGSPAVQDFLGGVVGRIGIVAGNIASAVQMIAKSGLRAFFTDTSDGFTFLEGMFIDLGFSFEQAQSWGQTINKVALWIIDSIHAVANAFQTDKALVVAVMSTLGLIVAAGAISIIAPLLPAIIVIGLIGGAIYLAYRAWTENWGGIQQKTAAVWGWLQPILQNIWNWLSVNVPLALQTLQNWWSTTTTMLSSLWTSTLLPAIQAVWGFLSTYILPLLGALASVIIAVVGNAIKQWAAFIGNILIPNLAKLWDWIEKNILPTLQKFASWVSEKVSPALHGIGDAIKGVIKWLSDLASTINSIKLPDWMTPGSPTPWEIGLRGVSSAMEELSRKQLPSFHANLGFEASPAFAGAGALPAVGVAPSGGAGGGSNEAIALMLDELLRAIKDMPNDISRSNKALVEKFGGQRK